MIAVEEQIDNLAGTCGTEQQTAYGPSGFDSFCGSPDQGAASRTAMASAKAGSICWGSAAISARASSRTLSRYNAPSAGAISVA